MARKRQISPEAFDDPDLNAKPPLARWLFAGLWTRADREGRLRDEPKRLKVQLLPYDDCDIDGLLDLLAPRHILRYEVDGKGYIQIRKFKDHQHPHPDEAKSVIPPPPDAKPSGGSGNQRQAVKSPGEQLNTTAGKACTCTESDPESGSQNGGRTAPDDGGRAERVYQRLIVLSAEHQHQSLPLSLKPADWPKLAELLSRYPDDAMLDAVMLEFVRSSDKEIRVKPITIGWFAYWAGKCEARVRGAPSGPSPGALRPPSRYDATTRGLPHA